MASFKVSEFAGVANATDDSLLMLSYTTDSGSSYETRKIRIADLFDDLTEDPNLTAVITLTGMPAGSTNLGSFTGDTIADNLTIKQALQSLEVAVEGKQDPLSAGNGIEITGGGDINVLTPVGGYLSFTETAELVVNVLDEDDLVSNSDTDLPTQQSVKAYVDNAVSGKVDTSDAILKDGSVAFTGAQSMGGFGLNNLAAPVVGADAATKAYVDSATSGQGAFWTTVKVASETPITLSGVQTIDGVLAEAGDRVLVAGQTAGADNGIYVVGAGAWTRSTDADNAAEFVVNKTVYVSEGTTNAGNVYAYGGPEDPSLGVDTLNFLLKQESAGIQDGSITTVKLADGAVTDAKVSDVSATKLTGVLNDAQVQESNVTQHEAALELAASQVTSGTFDDARISETSVTQHQAALSITESQISDLQDYALQTSLDATNLNVTALTTLSGVPALSTSLGTFTGDTIADSATIKEALQSLETAVEGIGSGDLADGADIVKEGDNVNRLVGSTGADGEPANFLFLVVDQLDGSIKAIDKTFIEIE